MEQKVKGSIAPERDEAQELVKLEEQHKSGANWFYWIAVLSIINSGVTLAGGQWGFIIGLGITQVADAIGAAVASEFGTGIELRAMIFLFDAFVAGLFVLFGMLARKRHTWAFVTGMALYAADGLIFLLAGDWLSLAFHGFALFCLFGGLSASRKLSALSAPAEPELTSQPVVP
jgi:hypothetical protein